MLWVVELQHQEAETKLIIAILLSTGEKFLQYFNTVLVFKKIYLCPFTWKYLMHMHTHRNTPRCTLELSKRQ